MEINIYEGKNEMGKAAAELAIKFLKKKLLKKEIVNLVLATGASQFDMLSFLVETKEVDWSRVQLFHLDEYIALSEDHPASFRRYLKERFVNKVANLKNCFFINGDADDIVEECQRLNQLIKVNPIDLAMVGIGENGHLAFNDPPADFETKVPFIKVELDEACRMQQLGEGWFPNLEAVPQYAITMSIQQILKSKAIICTVPEKRKAKAVAATLTDSIGPKVPATILRKHPNAFLFLDKDSSQTYRGL